MILVTSASRRQKFSVHCGRRVKAKIDEDRIREATVYDSYYGICYSNANMTADEVLSIHHSLWQIEELFRISKSILKTRPCFHWTERRIRGHFVSCFLALVLHRLLEVKLAANGINIASPMLVDALAGADHKPLNFHNTCGSAEIAMRSLCGKFFLTFRCQTQEKIQSSRQYETGGGKKKRNKAINQTKSSVQ